MNLDRYRVPTGVWSGEWLELPDSGGARFLVKLPATSNREWQREMLAIMVRAGVRVNAQGAIETEAVDTQAFLNFQTQRLEAFARLCIVQGPEGFDLTALQGEYWPALVTLYELAEARASEQAQEIEESVGESSALLAGSANGQGGKHSTRTSSARAGSR